MLNYTKAVSVFFIWAAFALTSHYFIITKGSVVMPTKSAQFLDNLETNGICAITNITNDTIYQFNQGFIILKNTAKLTPPKNIQTITDSIQNYLTFNYDSQLHIIGTILDDETTTNIGLDRAKLLKETFISKGISPFKIHTSQLNIKSKFNTTNTFSNGIHLKIDTLPSKIIDSIEQSISLKTFYLNFDENYVFTPTNELKQYSILLAKFIKKYPSKQILITGHTDNNGYYQNNLIIGLNRANKLMEYFINNGINANNMNTVSKGESDPIATKYTEEGKAKNRRIEITIN